VTPPSQEEPQPGELTAQPIKGDPEAPVAIVEFAEFYCPFCARYLWQTYPKIYEEYIAKGLVRYEFRNLIVHGEVALLAAVAGECAHRQGRFWPFHDRIFEAVFPGGNVYRQEQLDLEDLKGVAAEVGLDMEAFSSCLEGYHQDYQSCQEEYDRCLEEGRDQAECAEGFNSCLGGNELFQEVMADREELIRLIEALPEEPEGIGTPTFFINGRLLIGAQPFENFKRMIEEALEGWEGR
jgi:protein-disulfide isomerase